MLAGVSNLHDQKSHYALFLAVQICLEPQTYVSLVMKVHNFKCLN